MRFKLESLPDLDNRFTDSVMEINQLNAKIKLYYVKIDLSIAIKN